MPDKTNKERANMASNQDKIKSKLLRGDRLTVVGVRHSCGTTELRTYIARLRKTLTIKDEHIKTDSGYYKEYFIPKELLPCS